MTTQEVIDHTKQLIRIPSTADNPKALKDALEYVANIVATIPGVTIERFERNNRPSFLAYRGKKRPYSFDLLLNAHLDVVPAAPEQFEPYEEDGKLYGRGALDMKGTAMALTKVFCDLVHEVPYELALQIVTDEEIGGYDGVRLQLNEGVRSKFVVVGEYANDRNTIYNAARGLCWAEIVFNGTSAHGGHLWHGTNAVVKAGDFAGAILKRFPTPDKETWTTTASIASLTTPNDTYNKVPDKAIMKIDFRFTQEDPIFQSRESLEAFIASIDPEAELVNLAVFEPAVNVEELNPYVQGLSAALKKVSKVKPRFLGRPAGSDGRHYALFNMDIIEFGIYGKHSHSDKEYAELDSVESYCDIMTEFLRNPIPTKLKKHAKVNEPLQEQLLRKLVGMKTLSEQPKSSYAAFDFIEDFLSDRGMFVERYERNGFQSVLATSKKGNKKPKVLLNAHVDVVPAPEEMFELKLKDGKFLGRGVMDMKHAIASYLTVVDALEDDLAALDFGLMITCDEEIGGNNGVRALVNEEGWRPEVVITPDGGNNWDIETFAKGGYWIQLEATGKRAHASRPWEGDSAIRRLLGAIKEIETLVPANPKPKDTLLSVGVINGGTVANLIPSAASAMLDIRTGSKEDHERLRPAITEICAQHKVNANFVSDDPPVVTDTKHPLVKPMIDIVEQVTGSKHGTTYDFAMTDGRLFSQVGIPVIVINPECGGIHTDGEWISREGLAQFCRAIELYVRQVAAEKPADKPGKRGDIALLAERLNKNNKPTYIWYATYGSGLSKKNFLRQIKGGRPEGSVRTYLGCTDPAPPKRDMFLSLPHGLYFAGDCAAWGGGGHINIDPRPSVSARTIARAYLITIEQFEEIAAQQNERSMPQPLPYREAMQHGHTTVGKGTGHYDELVFCGMNDGIPMFTLTAVQPELPYMPPNPVYTRLLCKGLSENAEIDKQSAIKYVMATPGVKQGYKKQDIVKFFDDNKPSKR